MSRLIVLAFVVAACGDHEPPSTGPVPAPKPRGVGDKTVVESAAKDSYLGVLTPRETNQVVSPLSAPIAEIDVSLGTRVTKGQVVARFDAKELKQQLTGEEATLHSRQAAVGSAMSAVALARGNYLRDKKAFEQAVGSKEAMEQSLAHMQEAQSQVGVASGQADQQKAVITTLKERIKDTTITAPRDGKVGEIVVHQHDRVEAGRPVMRIDSDGDAIVKFAIPGEDASKVAAGDKLEITFDADAKPLQATVRSVAPNIDPVAQMIVAEADLQNAPPNLPTGKRCHVRRAK